jgi:beta-galactosidase
VSTQLEDDAYRSLVERAMRAAGIELPGLPAGVELIRRRAGETSWTILINHGEAAVVVPVEGHELLSGADVTGDLTLAAGAQAVVRS